MTAPQPRTVIVCGTGSIGMRHLRVLREVGLVHVRREGRQMLYRTNAQAIRPLHEWTVTFERFLRHQLSRIKERAEEKMKTVRSDFNPKNFNSRRKDDPNNGH